MKEIAALDESITQRGECAHVRAYLSTAFAIEMCNTVCISLSMAETTGWSRTVHTKVAEQRHVKTTSTHQTTDNRCFQITDLHGCATVHESDVGACMLQPLGPAHAVSQTLTSPCLPARLRDWTYGRNAAS
jgi:hypothetical protein